MDDFEKDIRNMLGITNREQEELPIVLEILQEKMLFLDGEINAKALELLKIYYNCFSDEITLKGIGAARFREIGNELKRKGIIPSDKEMYELINERKKSGVQNNIANTGQSVGRILKLSGKN